MKRTFLALFSLTILLVTSCKKEDDVTPETAFFQCKIDNVEYKIEGTGAYAYFDTSEDRIYGTEVVDKSIKEPRSLYIAFPRGKSVGTFAINDDNNYAFFLDSKGVAHRSNYKNSSGTLTISEKTDKIIKGTFSFTANTQPNGNGKKITVTDGNFSVVYR